MKKEKINLASLRNTLGTYLFIPALCLSHSYKGQDQFNSNSQITQSVLDASSFSTGNTGSVDISIPITNISIENFNIDVKLKHNSTGVKINRDADLFGVNWDINAVGLISREIKGLPDELPQMVILESNLGGCTKLSQMQNVGYFYNRDRVKNFLPAYEAGYPNIPLSVSADLTTNGLSSHFFKPPRFFTPPTDDPGLLKDYEPDVFTVIIPGYKAFKFFFDLDKKIVISSDDNYRISHVEQDGEIASFEVIDKNGTKFKFSNKEKRKLSNLKTEFENAGILENKDISASIETPPVLGLLCAGYDQSHVDNFKKQFTKSWYLDLITNTHEETISFTYKNLELYSITPAYGKKPYTSDYIIYPNNEDYGYITWEYSPFGGSYPVSHFRFLQSALVTTTPIIKSISNKDKIVYLNEGNLREDIFNNTYTQYKEIKSIDVWTYTGPRLLLGLDYFFTYFPNSIPDTFKKIQTFDFDYFYSFSNGGSNSAKYAYANKRLFLNSITQKVGDEGIIKYYLTYNGDLNVLPDKQTTKRDLWNYYKENPELNFFHKLYYYPDDGRNNVDLGPVSFYPRQSYTGSEVSILNYYSNYPLRPGYFGDKTPEFNNTSIGSLKSIMTSMGGVTNFIYEPNYIQYYGVKRPSGGIRIKSIENVESGKKNITDFYYGQNSNGVGHVYMNTGINRLTYNPDNTTRFDQNAPHFSDFIKLNFLDEASTITYYDEVKKVKNDENGNSKGYTVSKYSLFKDNNHTGFQLGNVFYKSNIFSSYSLIYHHSQNQNMVYYTNNTKDYYPFNEKEDFSEINGYLLNEKTYDSSNVLLKENNYTYDLKVQEYKFLKDDNTGWQPAGSLYKLRKYDYLLQNTLNKDYFNNNTVTTNTTNTYNQLNLLKKVSTVFPDNSIFSNELKYCYETDNSFVSLNRLSEICEEKETKNNKSTIVKYLYKNLNRPKLFIGTDVMGSFYTYYGSDSENVLYTTQTSLNGTTFKDGVKINTLGEFRNVLETEANTVPETTIYGYHQNLPIAKIKGASYNQVLMAFNLDPANYEDYLNLDIIKKSNLDVDISTEGALIAALDTFRSNAQLKNYEITTYTYDPGIGVTSMTLPNGIREYYKYDLANRLSKILDKDNNFIKEIKYGNAPIKFYNRKITRILSRNNCNAYSEDGGQYSYVVPQYTYSSVISQADADQQAENEINTTGQSQANASLPCTPKTICTLSFANNFIRRSHPSVPEIYKLPNAPKVYFDFSFSGYPINADYWSSYVTVGYVSGCITKPDYFLYEEVPGGLFGNTPANRTWQIGISTAGEIRAKIVSGSVGNNSYNAIKFQFSSEQQ
ncbi:DUF5977 domain-containing protein [Chryseobacterium sp. ISL-6]|uniref:DUF5977 domain-containing protein n=1 Tax=Chryseobacterium sp. ISL-6 TaxID=2819143 RepID=UPI001BE6994E|nr:DUF5977 domain-containing protein [Chryseobacterium sp. ISL-6]MBT2620062.1 hypothetical protein [Chryseobacterium sp. ISL-6]